VAHNIVWRVGLEQCGVVYAAWSVYFFFLFSALEILCAVNLYLKELTATGIPFSSTSIHSSERSTATSPHSISHCLFVSHNATLGRRVQRRMYSAADTMYLCHNATLGSGEQRRKNSAADTIQAEIRAQWQQTLYNIACTQVTVPQVQQLTVIIRGTVRGRNDETVAHFAIHLPGCECKTAKGQPHRSSRSQAGWQLHQESTWGAQKPRKHTHWGQTGSIPRHSKVANRCHSSLSGSHSLPASKGWIVISC